MYYVPDGTKMCGFYECKCCGGRFLSIHIAPRLACPDCAKEVDMEIGPDEEITEETETAVLLSVIEGEENVERYDHLLSLAVTGGDFEWL